MSFKEVLDQAFMDLDISLCERIWHEHSVLLEETKNALRNISQSAFKNAGDMVISTKKVVQSIKLYVFNNLKANLPRIEYESTNTTSSIGRNIIVDSGDSEMKYVCEHCGTSVSSQSKLQQHVKSVHSRINGIKCNKCDASFSTNGNLTKHVNSVHLKVKRYSCSLCEYKTFYKQNLQKHYENRHSKKESKKEFICPESNLPFHGMARINKHMTDMHDIDTPPIYDQSSDISLNESQILKSHQCTTKWKGHHSYACGNASSNKETLGTNKNCLRIKKKNKENNESAPNSFSSLICRELSRHT